jgi:hypothetical protein
VVLVAVFLLLSLSNPPQLFAYEDLTIIQHPKPPIGVNATLYSLSNCYDEVNYRVCSKNSPLGRLGCSRIYSAPETMGGLTPALPILLCSPANPASGTTLPAHDFVFNAGCREPLYMRYVVWKDGKYLVVRNRAELRSLYAPIESADEALGYAIAATGYTPLYSIPINKSFRFYSKRIEDSRVDETGIGYQVHLFSHNRCGCGPHPYNSIVVTVERDGTIQESAPLHLFDDPAEDSFCGE